MHTTSTKLPIQINEGKKSSVVPVVYLKKKIKKLPQSQIMAFFEESDPHPKAPFPCLLLQNKQFESMYADLSCALVQTS